MSKKYMQTPQYCFNYILDYSFPPMTVEEYKSCEEKYFDLLIVKVTTVEKPIGIFARLLQFVGISRAPAITDSNDDNKQPLHELQGGGDKKETARSLLQIESFGHGDEVDVKTLTDLTETDSSEININTNTAAGYNKSEPTADEVHAVASNGSVKEEPDNDDSDDKEQVKGKKKLWKSFRKFLRRPFKTCLKTED